MIFCGLDCCHSKILQRQAFKGRNLSVDGQCAVAKWVLFSVGTLEGLLRTYFLKKSKTNQTVQFDGSCCLWAYMFRSLLHRRSNQKLSCVANKSEGSLGSASSAQMSFTGKGSR